MSEIKNNTFKTFQKNGLIYKRECFKINQNIPIRAKVIKLPSKMFLLDGICILNKNLNYIFLLKFEKEVGLNYT